MPTSRRIRVCVADDHTLFRRGLTALLASDAAIQVVGEAVSGEDALRVTAESRPDVLLLDIHMPPPDGIEVARRLRAGGVPTRVVFLTMAQDSLTVLAATEVGAYGFVPKDADEADLLAAIHAAWKAPKRFDSEAGREMILMMRAARGRSPAGDFPKLAVLTHRELDVLRLMAQGYRNQAIAQELGVSVRTTKYHVTHILQKLGVEHRSQAVIVAIRTGLTI